MDSNKKVLIITYRFPPMGGVGSRRWAKFSKYFARAGWDVHVITTDYPWIDAINWNSDIEGESGISVVRLRSGYPNLFMRPYRSKLMRAVVRLCRIAYDAVMGDKSRLDYASAWTETLVSHAVEYIRAHRISNVIVSGPPSSLHLSAALIKCEVPFIRLIQDYRDPWSNVHDYGMRNVKSAAKKVSMLHAESLSLQAADKAVVVSAQMADDLCRTFSIPGDKVEVIYNGYDVSDFDVNFFSRRGSPGAKIRVGYFGAIGRTPHGRMKALEMMADALEGLDGQSQARFEFSLYSDLPSDYFVNSTKVLLRSCACLSMVPKETMMSLLNEFDICLAINGPNDAHAIASKIYDYMGAMKPILLISPPGEAGLLLSESGQYAAGYDNEQIRATLQQILADYDQRGGLVVESGAIYSKFDLRVLSEKYIRLLVT